MARVDAALDDVPTRILAPVGAINGPRARRTMRAGIAGAGADVEDPIVEPTPKRSASVPAMKGSMMVHHLDPAARNARTAAVASFLFV